MKIKFKRLCKAMVTFFLAGTLKSYAAVHYVDANGTNPVPPFADWGTAARTIQDAVDVSSGGDLVWVTNGVYATGGRLMGGNLTNRVILDKALTVQSVNGPLVTAIEGVNGVNGYGQARGVWMTNGAVLSGFTVRGGRTLSSGIQADVNGGGIWGSSTTARATNCVITANFANSGGGASHITLVNCTITGNSCGPGIGQGGGIDSCNATNCVITRNASDRGGGAEFSNLRNCVLTQNKANSSGGGAENGILVNCTVTGNLGGGGTGGGTANNTLVNCIVYGNRASFGSTSNYSGSTFSYSCTSPLPTGTGNFDADPQLISDGTHVNSSSPCRGAGTALAGMTTDIDGQPWASPPSVGCDEYTPAPVVATPLRIDLFRAPLTLSLRTVGVAGQEPFVLTWAKDGVLLTEDSHHVATGTTNLVVPNFGPGDAGIYTLILSNAFGVSSGAVQIVTHCVDAAGIGPVAPYADWQTAATNIQDAIDAAMYGEFVLVTNGIYANGGRVMAGDLTNRVVLNKPLIVASVHGADLTIVQGSFDPVSTNGPSAVRCAWVTDGATLDGFTLRNGATRMTGDFTLGNGGGVWGPTSNAVVVNCVISTNAAYSRGGGCYKVFVGNSKVLGNRSVNSGGGAYQCSMVNSLIQGNSASQDGGGAYDSSLTNSTVTGNTAFSSGGGVYSGVAVNSIVYNNQTFINPLQPNWTPPSKLLNSCTTPLPAAGLNISADPQLLNGAWLTTSSPCRGAGSALYSIGKDIDGEAWANPPSMGCDELWEAAVTGPLSVGLRANPPTVIEKKTAILFGQITGRATHVTWSFGDGSVLTNVSLTALGHSWTNAGDYTVTFTAFNVDYPGGVSTNLIIQVVPLAQPIISEGGLNGSGFSLSFSAQPGASYVVEQTTNLTPPAVWQTVASVTANTTNVLQITDTKATNANRFYRVRAL